MQRHIYIIKNTSPHAVLPLIPFSHAICFPNAAFSSSDTLPSDKIKSVWPNPPSNVMLFPSLTSSEIFWDSHWLLQTHWYCSAILSSSSLEWVKGRTKNLLDSLSQCTEHNTKNWNSNLQYLGRPKPTRSFCRDRFVQSCCCSNRFIVMVCMALLFCWSSLLCLSMVNFACCLILDLQPTRLSLRSQMTCDHRFKAVIYCDTPVEKLVIYVGPHQSGRWGTVSMRWPMVFVFIAVAVCVVR